MSALERPLSGARLWVSSQSVSGGFVQPWQSRIEAMIDKKVTFLVSTYLGKKDGHRLIY
jgi:hypothetical protein